VRAHGGLRHTSTCPSVSPRCPSTPAAGSSGPPATGGFWTIGRHRPDCGLNAVMKSHQVPGGEGTPSRYAERPLDWVEEGPLHPCLVTDVGAFSVIPPKCGEAVAPGHSLAVPWRGERGGGPVGSDALRSTPRRTEKSAGSSVPRGPVRPGRAFGADAKRPALRRAGRVTSDPRWATWVQPGPPCRLGPHMRRPSAPKRSRNACLVRPKPAIQKPPGIGTW
jgi:hypothetical protein